MHTPPEHVPTQGTNRSYRFPKQVRPVHQTGQAGSQNRSDRFNSVETPPKAKNAKEMYKLPLDYWDRFLTIGIGSRDAMQLFSAFLSPPCCQCMNPGSNLEKMQLKLLKYAKFITRCYTFSNEQVRYSTGSYEHQLHDHQD
jgi:hypothetical protein